LGIDPEVETSSVPTFLISQLGSDFGGTLILADLSKEFLWSNDGVLRLIGEARTVFRYPNEYLGME